MLRLLFCFLLCLSTNFLLAKQVSFIGKIDQPLEDKVFFKINKNTLSGESMMYNVPLKDDYTFGISIETGGEEWVQLKHGEITIDIYTGSSQQQRLELNFNGLNQVETLRFSGEDAMDNAFLSNFNRLFHNHQKKLMLYNAGGMLTSIDGELAQKAKSYAAEDYFAMIDQRFKSQKAYLNTQTNLNAQFFIYFDKAIGWNYEINKIAYFLLNKDRFSIDELRMYWGRYAVLQSTDINDDKSVQYEVYQNLLTAFVHYLDIENPGDASAKDMALYRFINGNLSGRSGFFMLAKLILDNYQRDSNPRLVHRRFKTFKRDNPYREYTQTLEAIFGANLEYVPKQTVQDFKSQDVNGDLVFLSDYAGKVVYVSFWASWCRPCLSGFRQTQQTRQQLSNSGVVFINVNVDEDEGVWKKTLSGLDLPGRNVFIEDFATIQKDLKFKALPHYILLNKSGLLTYLSTDDFNSASQDFYQLLRE